MWISKEKYEKKYKEIEEKILNLRIENERFQAKIRFQDERFERLLAHLGLYEWKEPQRVEPEKVTLITKKEYKRRTPPPKKGKQSGYVSYFNPLHDAQQNWIQGMLNAGSARKGLF